jgi:hypothetical protein
MAGSGGPVGGVRSSGEVGIQEGKKRFAKGRFREI